MRTAKSSIITVLALVLLLAGAALAQSALPKGVERVTAVEGITEYRLPNGLRVLLFPDQTKQTITVNITYLVGSRHENYGETGMAHLLEHLVFKGTPKHPNIPQELSEHGARPNGTTWLDRTNYYATFAATDENLKWALDLEADRMINSFIAKKDLDSEFTVVRNEFEMGENSPFGVLMQKTMAVAYDWHNYGKDTIGARSDIENVPIERLQAFYRRYYQPDNAVLMVAGKFDEAKTLALVNEYFAPIPRPERELPKIYTQEPTQDGERSVTLRRVGDEKLVMLAYHIPAGSHPDFAAIDVLSQILSDTPSGRLHKVLVETRKASGIFGFGYQLYDPGLLMFGAQLRKEDPLDEVREILLKTVEDFTQSPPTREEVERARQQLLKQFELTLNSSERVGLQLSEWMAQGDWRLFFLHRDRIRKVTAEDVQRVAGHYLKQSNRTLGQFIPTEKPDRAEIPATPDVLAMVKDYKGDAGLAAGEAFDPSPANIEARTARPTAGGVEMALLTKQTRGNSVNAMLTLRLGDEKSLMNRSTAGEMAAAMLNRGTSKHTRQQIQDEFDKLRARVSFGGGTTAIRVAIETVRENLPAVLRLVGEILRDPAFPADEFEQLKQQQIAGIEQQKSDPTAQAALAFQRHMNPYPKGDVRYVETFDESLAAVRATTLEDVKKFYADFYGASRGEISIVGDFDEKETARTVNELFSDWKNRTPYKRIPSEYQEVAVVSRSIETPDKANAFFIAGLPLRLRDDNPDYPALLLGNYMLGGGFLNSRLMTRIRQKDGLSYSVGSQISAGSIDENGTFVTYAIYAPQNAEKLEAAFREELARALKDGFTAEEIASAKKGWLQAQQVSRAQDRELAGRLSGYLFLDRTLAWDAELEKKVAALSADQILTAMRKYIDPAKISIFKAGDFAKAAATGPSGR